MCRGRDSAAVVLAAKTAEGLYVGVLDRPADRGIPQSRGRASRHLRIRVRGATTCARSTARSPTNSRRRGAWARCVQVIGALDAARDLTVAHTSERVQFGRPLSKFQAVQHSLAEMAGEIERARAATELAIAAATDFGFDSAATDYAVTVAKVATGPRRRVGDHDRAPTARGDRCDRRAPAVAVHDAGTQLGRRIRHHRALRAAVGQNGARRRRPVAGRRQLSRTSLTRASTSTPSPRSVRSMPNRSVRAVRTSAAVSKSDFRDVVAAGFYAIAGLATQGCWHSCH